MQVRNENDSPDQLRRYWMSVLSRAPLERLERCWQTQPSLKKSYIRAPEIGLMMVRGRAGGSGEPFNLGEMTMTRCAVELANGVAGFGYVPGRNKRHSELAALLDAALQDSVGQQSLLNEWIDPMHEAWLKKRKQRAEEVATTKVDFFTMVRGE